MMGVGHMLSGSTVPRKYLVENFVSFITFRYFTVSIQSKDGLPQKVTKQEL